mmetsp:Transcript_85448/g.204769  ORF Transcript_85448/g.204769 Transcript_85448/m.204769 type:complete len:494 (-) Transcript_85448:15-1496(-)
MNVAQFEAVLARLETVAERLEKGTVASSGGGAVPNGGPAEDDAIAVAFDAFLQTNLLPVETAAKDLGEQDVTEAMGIYSQGLKLLRELLVATAKCQKPQDADWQKILAPVMELGSKAQKACDPRSDFFQHRKACAESLNIIMLVTSPSPPSHVQSVLETFDFHAMKVMQKKVEKETNWIKAVKESLKALKEWCTETCKLGVTWNVKGQVAMEYFIASPLGSGGKGGSAAPQGKAKGKGKGPPPPKGGFAAMPEELRAKLRQDNETAKAAPAGAGMSAVFNAIGGFNTSQLKKVTADMKTKNQAKDGPQVVPAAKAKAPPARRGGFNSRGPKGEPKKELQKDVNWMVENFEGERVVMEEATMKHLVCILNCRNTTVQIPSKVKSVQIDSCEKVNVIVQDVISAVELVNSDRCQMQALGKVVAVAIDKCDGVNVWLSKESVAAEITASKSSEMNVTIPDPEQEDGDLIEIPIPEQFVSRVVGKKLKTDVSGIYSG